MALLQRPTEVVADHYKYQLTLSLTADDPGLGRYWRMKPLAAPFWLVQY
jgi:hypothetical protein